jgi:hypothetical protein
VGDRLVKYSSCLMIIVNKRSISKIFFMFVDYSKQKNISKIFFIFDDSQKVRVCNYRLEKCLIKLLIRITKRLKILFDSTGLPLDQHVWNSFGVGPCGNDGGGRQLSSGKKKI